MWTSENRPKYDRSKLRYPSDLTDEEWLIIGPLVPDAKGGGNKRTVDVREVLNGVMYILSTGCQWAALPKDLPPRSTVNDYLRRWDEDRTLDRIHHALYVLCREQAGRDASPTAAIIDSQSVKSAEKGGGASIPRATTRARRSKARNGTSWSTPKGC
jgi:transposase